MPYPLSFPDNFFHGWRLRFLKCPQFFSKYKELFLERHTQEDVLTDLKLSSIDFTPRNEGRSHEM